MAPWSSIWCGKCCKKQLFTDVGILLFSVSSFYVVLSFGPNFDDFRNIFLCFSRLAFDAGFSFSRPPQGEFEGINGR